MAQLAVEASTRGALAMIEWQAELLDSLQSALIVTDREGNVLLWNRAAERFYGYDREQMQGSNVMVLFVPGEELNHAMSIMDKVLAGQTWTGEFPVACANGTRKRVRITDSPLIRDGEVVGVVGLAEELPAESAAGRRASTDGLSDLARALAELDGLRTAMKTRGVIERAKGMLMASLGIDDTAAFEVLRRLSQRSNRKLVDIAREVVDGPSTVNGGASWGAISPGGS